MEASALINRTILAAAKLQTIELCYGPGESVYERGAPAQFVYVVDEGALCRLRLLTGGRRSILQFLFRDHGFGYEAGRQHRDTVQTLTHTKVLAAGRGSSAGRCYIRSAVVELAVCRCSTGRSSCGRHPSRWAAVTSIAAKIGCTPQTLHDWVKKAEVDRGQRAGVPTDMADKLKALERENRELRQANEILRKASAYFATAELDRRYKP